MLKGGKAPKERESPVMEGELPLPGLPLPKPNMSSSWAHQNDDTRGCTMNEKKNWMMTALSAIENKPHVLLLFGMLVLGIVANWFWTVGWEYLNDPSAGLQLGSALEIAVRVVLGVIAAALTFVPAYREIAQAGGERWVAYLLAFQNGFFWEAAPDSVVRHFTG